ncbi:hypothetical protein ebA5531 [Aromatoleum aromaticum EbN1]|uniref:Uncharacterized protein n=1 Tax=Aromatoleum aromaticum (strain DSM 19018 / LMG 30748 / EbN1) TaxID=76114 RepID=Q5P092_AROAE|nr:hypothetical protein ebA5531 [Aromatoleum aromaticum EbN1]
MFLLLALPENHPEQASERDDSAQDERVDVHSALPKTMARQRGSLMNPQCSRCSSSRNLRRSTCSSRARSTAAASAATSLASVSKSRPSPSLASAPSSARSISAARSGSSAVRRGQPGAGTRTSPCT